MVLNVIWVFFHSQSFGFNFISILLQVIADVLMGRTMGWLSPHFWFSLWRIRIWIYSNFSLMCLFLWGEQGKRWEGSQDPWTVHDFSVSGLFQVILQPQKLVWVMERPKWESCWNLLFSWNFGSANIRCLKRPHKGNRDWQTSAMQSFTL